MGSAFGYQIDSELPLRRLRAANGSRGVLEVRRADADLLGEAGRLSVLQEEDRLQPGNSFAIATVPEGLLVACSATGSYRIDARRGIVLVDPRGPEDAWEHRVLAVVLPLLLSERGDLVLHAAAIEYEGRALVFAGPTTRGKSTLALAFARFGRPVLSEDGVVIGPESGPMVWPGASGIRVREPGSAAAPRRVEYVGETDPPPVPTGALVLLEERGAELRVEPLAGAEALTALAPHLVHSGGQEGLGPAFSGLARVLGEVAAFRASLPDDLDLLPDAAAELARRVTPAREPAGA
ncbi:MAG TPA: hypothetical protein VKA89_09060 [Solirubrobacterales bacterium]|nr:hypothetical protein [Solirubrobacterales bacterium]